MKVLNPLFRDYPKPMTCGAIGGNLAKNLGLPISNEIVALLCGMMAENRDSYLVNAVYGLLGYLGVKMIFPIISK